LKEAQEKKEQSAKRLAELLGEMKEINLKDINFQEILKVLKKGLLYLGELREQWSKLVSFFNSLCNLITVNLSSRMKTFAVDVESNQKLVAGFNLGSIQRDMLLNSASSAGQVIFVVQSLTQVYVEVSKGYLTVSLASLGLLCHFDPQTDASKINEARRKLDSDVTEAQNLIGRRVQQHLDTIGITIATRIEEFDQLGKLLPPVTPQVQKQIEDATNNAQAQKEKEVAEEKRNEPSIDDY